MLACPTCRLECPTGKKFCGVCGSRLEERDSVPAQIEESTTLECPRCRRPNAQTAKFCRNCGMSLKQMTGAVRTGGSSAVFSESHQTTDSLPAAGEGAAAGASNREAEQGVPLSPPLLRSFESGVTASDDRGQKLWILAAIAAGCVVLVGFGTYWWVGSPARSSPNAALLQARLAAELPSYVSLARLEVQTAENLGTAAEPVFKTRFHGSLVLGADTFVKSSDEDGTLLLAPRLKKGAVREVAGLVLSRLTGESWSTEFSLDNELIADLGEPHETFQAARVIIIGSPEETAFREEQRRFRESEAEAVQARLRDEEQARLGEARRQAEQIRVQAEVEAQRVRAEAARQAEVAARQAAERRTQEELEAHRQREQAERAATEAAEAERRRQAEEAERRRQADAAARITVPVGTEIDVRLKSTLNSGRVKVEDRFEATAVDGWTANGRTVIPPGSVLRGIVSSVQPATRTNRTARMMLSFDEMTVNGRKYPIRAMVIKTIEGPGIKGEAGRIAAGAGVGAIIGAILGGGKGAAAGAAAGGGGTVAATEGKEVELPGGTVLRVRFDSPVVVQ